MTKKLCLCVLAAALSAGALGAQTVALEGGINTFSNAKLGVEVAFSRFIVMAGVDGRFYRPENEYPQTPANDYHYTDWNVGILAGIAPVVAESGNWRLSLPILARVSFGKTPYEYDAARNVLNSTSEIKRLELGLRAGGRAAYAFSERWSFYTGFLLELAKWEKHDTYRYTTASAGGPTERRETYTYLRGFDDIFWELGVLFSL